MADTEGSLTTSASATEKTPLQDVPVAGPAGWWAIFATYIGGGILVCCTYAWGFWDLGERAPELWGRLLTDPHNHVLLNVYYASIAAAVAGYFFSLAYALHIAADLKQETLRAICMTYNGFYLSSCFWMPLCVSYVKDRNMTVYILIRVQLAVSGVLALAWAYSMFKVSDAESKSANYVLRLCGLLGSMWFALHCAVLDAMVWPHFFR